MTRLPTQMTDAAYQKALRDAEKQLTLVQAEHLNARSAWNTSSIKQFGIRRHLANWLRVRNLARKVRKNQAHLNFLLEFERQRNKD